MSMLDEAISAVEPLDRSGDDGFLAHLDALTKPPGSLGTLEHLALRLCRIAGTTRPPPPHKVVVVAAADHGVARRGVSAFPAEVTPQMVRNMLAGGAAISVLCRLIGAELIVADLGVADPLDGAEGLRRCKVRGGTDDLSMGPAMSVDEARAAITSGLALAAEATAAGWTLVGTGEMGIGNTTAAAALLATLLPCDPGLVTGRGTGIDDETLFHKTRLVRRALEINDDRLGTPLGALAALGGFEIAGLCGVMLGAAARRCPVVVDGFIATAAALAATRLCPALDGYLFFAHVSAESGHRVFFERTGRSALLDLGLRLGEGTGAALAFSLLEAAAAISREMATFEGASVSGAC